MTIGLTYNNDLSRVQIALSDLTGIDAVRVERSTNELLWETVRGGVALPVSSGAASLDDFDQFASDVENFYRIVPVNPATGLLLDGVSGSYASTPDHASLDIVGDIGLAAEITVDVWPGSGSQDLISKWLGTGDQRSYRMRVNADTLTIRWSVDGIADATLTATEPLPTGRFAALATLDVDNGSGGHTATFWTAPSIDGPWTQLGEQVVGTGTTSIFSGTADVNVGGRDNGTLDLFTGTVHAAVVKTGTVFGTGAIVADPDFANQPMGTTSFTDSTGKLWTVNGGAVIVGIEQAASSITPSLAGQVWLKSIRHPFLNRALPRVLFRDPSVGRPSRSTPFAVSGRSVEVGVSDVRLGRRFMLSVLFETDPLIAARDLDLVLASGDVFFIHVPAGHPLPGGYVLIGESNELPITGHAGSPREFTLPCTIVAAPGPEVVGATLNWAAVRRLYGDSWQAVRAANPTWGVLLDTIADPSDLVVL